jgi:transcription-repair coupling factor (superfamily II helicase)
VEPDTPPTVHPHHPFGRGHGAAVRSDHVTLPGLLAALTDPGVDLADAALAGFGGPGTRDREVVAPPGLRPFAVAATADPGPVLAVTATGREAEDLATALRDLLPPDTVAELPAWETLPHERLSPRADTVGRRLSVLRRLRHPGVEGMAPLRVVVAPVRSLLQPVVVGLGDVEPVTARVGTEIADGLDGLVDRLSALAYSRVDLVERRGEFAVRGGIVDVFPPTEEHPLRVELFGDEVESVRVFAVGDQRTIADAPPPPHGLVAPPCRELLLTPEVMARAAALKGDHAGDEQLAALLDKIASGIPAEGMEALTPVLAGELQLVSDVFPADAAVVVCDPEKVRARAHDLVRTGEEFLAAAWSAATVGGKAPLDLGAPTVVVYVAARDHIRARGHGWREVSPFSDDPESEALVSGARPSPSFRGDIPAALQQVSAWLADGWAVVLTTVGHGIAERTVQSLRDADLPARLVEELSDAPERRVASVVRASLDTGFVHPEARLALVTESDLTGTRGANTRDMRRLPSKRRSGIDPLALLPGDFVVHEKHGVGRFTGMERRTVGGSDREYLVIEYARGDQLRVPTDQLELVSRYSGGEAPSVHKLGGSDWAKAKGRARKAVKDIAAGLVQLYAARTSAPGHAFGPDTPWQRELEDAFPYVETPDQRAAIDEVKADMERPMPMDRVICGDVGYGKTEIAVRAAFKCVADGKQCAVLVPTTLLAQQHMQTFHERFAQFPVRLAGLSRFNSDKEATAVLEGLADGTVDCVVGTHRLLSQSVRFKDLGLVIVDEEQRFGVEHKERLKHLRANVDVLTMSATPIPRTLEMAITGIRELSTIDTPPEERHPVLTFVGPHDDGQIAAAIRRELLREGQVFYVHNRVESIDKAASTLRDLVPEARVEVAHGQMSEDQLERVMIGFWEREFDVLVCTTIVESGLDVSNANTLIMERADRLGLSQLHQLRGRVGRGRERAYAYFLYPPDASLSEVAHDRLATIAQHSDLGSGMAVAMKDLEIRGAGNLLGGEQSGHIAAVGFDLYIRLVGEAVSEFKGEVPQEAVEMRVELPVEALLPHDYVPSERLRLDAYRRLASASTQEQIEGVRAELLDRFGPLPEVVETLLAVASVRVCAASLGITDVVAQGTMVRFAPWQLPDSLAVRMKRLHPQAIVKPALGQVLVPVPRTGGMGSPALSGRPLLDWVATLLGEMAPAPTNV